MEDLTGDVDAKCEWDDGEPIYITVDPYREGIVRGVIHELLHVILYSSFKTLGNTIEEWSIRKIEEKLWLTMTKVDLARWRAIISKKV